MAVETAVMETEALAEALADILAQVVRVLTVFIVLMVRLAQVALAAEEVAAPLKMLGRQIKDTHPFVAVAAAVAV
jgi:hypothetical protein